MFWVQFKSYVTLPAAMGGKKITLQWLGLTSYTYEINKMTCSQTIKSNATVDPYWCVETNHKAYTHEYE